MDRARRQGQLFKFFRYAAERVSASDGEPIELPPGADWLIYRILLDKRLTCSRSELRAWTFLELIETHAVLDAVEAAEASAYQKAADGNP